MRYEQFLRLRLKFYMDKKKKCFLLAFFTIFIYFVYVNFTHDHVANIAVSIAQEKTTFQNTLRPTTSKRSAIENVVCPSGTIVYEEFCVTSPYKHETRRIEGARITLCTQGTLNFLHHLVALCHRWSGPISVAVYCTAEDYYDARLMVNSLRHCDFCVRVWVEWHFFYRMKQMPDFNESDIIQNCESLYEKEWRRRKNQDTYPINVGRNLARAYSHSPYVFLIDIELYPSPGILHKFNRMVETQNITDTHQVWVVPVFEVHLNYRVPMTKTELKIMFLQKKLISFHKYRCNICHMIPNLTQWINLEDANSETQESLEQLRVWKTVKRDKEFNLNYWEPFFIGTKKDPEFDIRLSWEGKQNKMQMAYEMCLKNYDFHIVENAFLVHAPGINVYNPGKEKYREPHAIENNKIMFKIKRKLIKTYGSIKNC